MCFLGAQKNTKSHKKSPKGAQNDPKMHPKWDPGPHFPDFTDITIFTELIFHIYFYSIN